MMMMLLLGQVRFNFFRARQNFGPATACSLHFTDTTTFHLTSLIIAPDPSSFVLKMRSSWLITVMVTLPAN
jgi:hypothetical protein